MSDVSMILPGAAEMLPIFAFHPSHGASAVAWPSANAGFFVHIDHMVAPHLATGVRIGNGTPSGNAKVGLYSSDGTTLTQVVLSASTALTGTNVTQDIPFTAVTQVTPSAIQDYWLFLAVDNGTATIVRASVGVASGIATGFKVAGSVATMFTTPATSQAISGLTGGSSGYAPILQLY